jgi:hypothetical protein
MIIQFISSLNNEFPFTACVFRDSFTLLQHSGGRVDESRICGIGVGKRGALILFIITPTRAE